LPDEPTHAGLMNIESISKRFAEVVQLLDSKGVIKSISQLADTLDTHKQSLSEILKGKRNLTMELASKICDIYSVNPAYLLLGSHPKFNSPESSGKRNNISYVPVKVQAGYGEQLDNPIFEADLEKFSLPGTQHQDDDYRCFEVEGDSMFPAYQNGDKVICSPLPTIYLSQAIRDYMVYVIVTENSLLLKRIVNKIKSDQCLELISDNDLFEPKMLPIQEVLEVWKVESLITSRNFPHRKEAS